MKVTFIEPNSSASLSACLPSLIAEALYQKIRQEEKLHDKNQGENDRSESN